MTTPTPTEPTQAPATPAQIAAFEAYCRRPSTKYPVADAAALLRDFVLSCLPPAIPEPGQRDRCQPCRQCGKPVLMVGNHVRDAWCFGCVPFGSTPPATPNVAEGPPKCPECKWPGKRSVVEPERFFCNNKACHRRPAWITPPPAPPTQASEGGWRDECGVERAFGNQWFVVSDKTFKTDTRQLLTDGSWGECGHSRGYFPSESAARAAFAKAPPPGVVTTHPLTHICDVPEFDPSEHRCPACNGEGSVNCPHGCEPAPAKADGGRPTCPKCPACGSDDTWQSCERPGQWICGKCEKSRPNEPCFSFFTPTSPAPSPPVGKVVIDRKLAERLQIYAATRFGVGASEDAAALSAAIAEAENGATNAQA